MPFKSLGTVNEIVEELDEVAGIYKAALERNLDHLSCYFEMLTAHNCGALSQIGLWMPEKFFCNIFIKFWSDHEIQSYEPWRQIAALASLLWIWLICFEKELSEIDKAYLKDQKMRLFFLIPDLLRQQKISQYAKSPSMPIMLKFDEAKFAFRYLTQSILEDDEETTPEVQPLLH